jgi:endonuclease/exonuclease/phosphatase family metal-dependent hydrolase
VIDRVSAAGGLRRILASIRLVLTLGVAVAGAGCAKAVNYPSPSGPLYTFESIAPPATPAPGPLRVVSFNIAYAIEIDRGIETLLQSEPLRHLDVLALQEMDSSGTGRIARALGMNAVYYPSGVHPKHHRDFGCAILSPWPLVDPRKVILPHGARVSGLRRAATSVVVVRGSERIRVYSVHLPSPAAVSGGDRKEQLRVLAADADSAHVPVVIAGDFNSNGKVSELAKAGFDWVTREIGPTRPVRLWKDQQYDHILTRGMRRASVADSMGVVADNHGASDHRPIWVVLVAAPAPH